MAIITDYIEDARRGLLDLTFRNRLINYRPSKARTIRILDENPAEIYETLVLKGKEMRFKPKASAHPESADNTLPIWLEGSTSPAQPTDELSVPWVTPLLDAADNQPRKSDIYLQTAFESDVLQYRLSKVFSESHSAVEEQGYTILYLALGFLTWYESPSSEKIIKSPLILIPVDLRRGDNRQTFTMTWTDEDIITNISLQEKLQELGVTLPEFEMPEDKAGIIEYFNAVKEAIRHFPTWGIYTDIYLDFFSFTKFIMYNDLDSASWPEGMEPAAHPLLNAIFNPTGSRSSNRGFPEEDVDKRLSAQSIYHIMDADSSQIAVIEDIKASRNLVVEGPPGTGKSQTIANAIAELLAQEKTVLFISEKMAALDVVKRRLDSVGLGDYCLELHSRKANKKHIIAELKRTLDLPAPRQIALDNDITKLEDLKKELNDYVSALHTPLGNRNLSPFTLFGLNEDVREHFETVSRGMRCVDLPSPERYTDREWTEAIKLLTDLAEVLPKVRPVKNNPWYCTEPGIVLPSDLQRLDKAVSEARDALNSLISKIAAFADATGITCPDNSKELFDAIGTTNLFTSSNPIDRNLLLNNAWNQPNPNTALFISQVRRYNEVREEVRTHFNDDILIEDLDALYNEFVPLTERFFILRCINPRYRAIKRALRAYYRVQDSRSDEELIQDLSRAALCKRIQGEIRSQGALGRSLFGSYWADENSNPSELEQFSKWIVAFRYQLLKDVFTERTVEILSHGASPETIHQAAHEADDARQKFLDRINTVSSLLNVNWQKKYGKEPALISFTDYDDTLRLWSSSIQGLIDWGYYSRLIANTQTSIALPIINEAESNDLPPQDLVATFEGNYIEGLLRAAFFTRPSLASFLRETHEKKIQQFTQLDKKIIEGNRLRLLWLIWRSLPDKNTPASSQSEMGILKSEFVKQRKLLPIRSLMRHAGGLIQKIKPCFMMSPLSVAQFLDPRTVKFDVIIFDEASQVKPQDALGSLLRGMQAVVIGDSRQLPPTSFFDRMMEVDPDSVDTTDALPSDIESILNLCKKGFPTKNLRWHYRSRHESLIALSNSQFYNNYLYVYPSPMNGSDELGLKLVHLPDCTYDRGVSSINRGEAQAVAAAVIEHFVKTPHKSLGVGTFNIKQQQAIEDEIETLLNEHPGLQQYFAKDYLEYCFVKNLETIQGDERDVIFISVGFGRDKYGKLTQNFGPLNQDGGERRLNVLMTRARERCVIFSNFKAVDLTVTETSATGVKILKQFLEYAETGSLPLSTIPHDDLESPFEESVYDYLISSGYQIHKQVGCAGFRIDLAVIDPEQPGRYFLGIECDGAQYHSSKVARDRDRLRQQILEGLGWRIYRIWSTDWYTQPATSKQRLLEAIENSKRAGPLKLRSSAQLKRTQKESIPESYLPLVKSGADDRSEEPNYTIPDYVQCTQISLDLSVADFIDLPTFVVVQAIVDIVAVESPVHIDEVYNRIRSFAGISRLGSRMKRKLEGDCQYAVVSKRVFKRGQFLWKSREQEPPLRRRLQNQSRNIEYISDEEIQAAVIHVLRSQYATPMEGIVSEVSRIFGIKATRLVIDRVDVLVRNLVKSNELETLPNGKIFFKDSTSTSHNGKQSH